MNILIIEDNEKYLKVAIKTVQNFFQNIEIVTASNWLDGYSQANFIECIGVITDMFMPLEEEACYEGANAFVPFSSLKSILESSKSLNRDAEKGFFISLYVIMRDMEGNPPVGIDIVEECIRLKKPVVIATDQNHHSKKFQAIYLWFCSQKTNPYCRLVDGFKGDMLFEDRKWLLTAPVEDKGKEEFWIKVCEKLKSIPSFTYL